MLTLYYTPTTCSTASHIALEEAGAKYSVEMVKLYRPEAVETYRSEVNPKGKVPALVVDGVLLTENVAILAYIARAFPAANLLPENPFEYARCLSIMAWFASDVHITRRQYRAPQRFTPEESAHAALAAAGRPAFWRNLQIIDQLYDQNNWLSGTQFTVADCYALVFVGWGIEDGQPMQDLPNLMAFKDRILGRPAVRRVLERERSQLLPQP